MTDATQTVSIPQIKKGEAEGAAEGATETPNAELTEHEQAMIAKAAANGADGSAEGEAEGEADPAAAAAATKPDNVPDEFWDAEKGEVKTDALLEALAAKAEAKEGEAEGDGEGEGEGDGEGETKSFDWGTLDKDALAAEVVANGGFTEDTVKDLVEKTGMPADMVQQYGEGQAALVKLHVNEMFDSVGGKDEFAGMIEWAGEELSDDEADMINAALDNPADPKTKVLVKGLHARYKSASGSEPTVVLDGERTSTSGDRFKSSAELTKAMSDPRYQSDMAYQKEVQTKLARSGKLL